MTGDGRVSTRRPGCSAANPACRRRTSGRRTCRTPRCSAATSGCSARPRPTCRTSSTSSPAHSIRCGRIPSSRRSAQRTENVFGARFRVEGGPSDAAARAVLFELRAYPFQQEILDRLDAERKLRACWRNLVVAATGTGKTVVAALDYRRVSHAAGAQPRLLFVAHRMDILEQARDTFRHALGDGSFGELLGDGHEPARHDHLFAMIQTLSRRDVGSRWPADGFEYVAIDECHHAPAPSYRAVVEQLRLRVPTPSHW